MLPVAALLVIGLVFISSRNSGGAIDMRTAANSVALGAGLQLDRPRFTGVTASGEPFEITAVSALPDRPMPTRIDLTGPSGKIRLGSGAEVSIRALRGALLRSEDRVTLDGNIAIETSDGYTAETAELLVDINAGTMTAPGPISAAGPSGSISARTMEMTRSQDGSNMVTVRFKGDVSVRFLQSPGAAD